MRSEFRVYKEQRIILNTFAPLRDAKFCKRRNKTSTVHVYGTCAIDSLAQFAVQRVMYCNDVDNHTQYTFARQQPIVVRIEIASLCAIRFNMQS